jgi:ABC-type proline/glycine betaine transport system permease subunit
MPDWILQFPESISLNIKDIIDQFITYITVNWKAFFDTMTSGLRVLLLYVNKIVSTIPWWLLIALVFILTFRICKKLTKAVLYSLMLFLLADGLWDYLI